MQHIGDVHRGEVSVFVAYKSMMHSREAIHINAAVIIVIII